LTTQINALEKELRDLVRVLAPSLLAVPGCGVLGAAMILRQTAGAARFRSEDAYARFTGTRRSRSGRATARVRCDSTAVEPHHQHRAAHDRCDPDPRVGPGKSYVYSPMGKGKTRTEAIRLLRRRLSDRVFTALLGLRRPSPRPAAMPCPPRACGEGAGRGPPTAKVQVVGRSSVRVPRVGGPKFSRLLPDGSAGPVRHRASTRLRTGTRRCRSAPSR
jgi:hypothetical protein